MITESVPLSVFVRAAFNSLKDVKVAQLYNRDYSKNSIRHEIKKLYDAGLIDRVSHGVYRRTPKFNEQRT